MDLAAALDPVAFAQRVGFTPDPWQARLLHSTSPRLLLNCCRQSGKSTITAILAMHTALYRPGSLVLLLSPSERQSKELFRKVLDVYRATEREEPPESETTLWLELGNGSRIVALPGEEGTVRGFSGVDLLVIDEASRVPTSLYASVRPMLAVSGGRLIAPSTPYGTRGWWYDAWRSEHAWERYEVPASDCPRITPAFLAEEQETLGEWWYRQEYFCEFLDAERAAFRREDIENAFKEEVLAWVL